ncbi:NADPH oxidase organizer 1b [Lepisosteus oculatus]|uniref:NADPH oxidase organizer 1b n=1 Tax=Lepisosteus oculatus TaxID=7918 RepID=UPI0035F502ED
MSVPRYPVDVRLIGVMHKNGSNMFMTSVFWSDQSDIVVYRSFGEFRKLHKQLKKKFPPENMIRKSDSVLPKFKARHLKTLFQAKGPGRSVIRLKCVEKYCGELLRCDPEISQSAEVIRFFLPQSQDLQPEFPKNSFVIMPPEDPEDSPRAGVDGKRMSEGNVTHPFVTETYQCVAPYETKDTKNQPFRVAVDEVVDVLIKDPAGWWLVENEDKQLAWFPAPYLRRNEDEGEEELLDAHEEGGLYCAVRTFEAKNADELSVHIGSVVQVIQTSDDGWWLSSYKGRAGYVPSMYLQPYRSPPLGFRSLAPAHRQGLSRSQELLRPAQSAAAVPPMGTADRKKWCSLDVLSDPRPGPVPTITVEAEREEPGSRKDSLSGDSELGCSSESFSSSSEFLGASLSDAPGLLGRSRTPQALVADRQSPDSGAPEQSLSSSSSEPNLYKPPSAPRVPPRPKAQEILTRCTTITCKAALVSKCRLSPETEEIQTR